MPLSETETEEWAYEWGIFRNDDESSLRGWMAPFPLEWLKGKSVLECGCGGGSHTAVFAQFADDVTAVDLNTAGLAASKLGDTKNVTFQQVDLTEMKLGKTFDVVICIGVIHHTDDPDAVFRNIVDHVRPGGKLVVWTYSAEGNSLVMYGVEPVRRRFLAKRSRKFVHRLAFLITAALYPFVYTLYLIPFLSFLPFFEYFKMFRKLNFHHNFLNVFDKLNAPQTKFTTRSKCDEWLSNPDIVPESRVVRRHLGVSYTIVAEKKGG